jgi:hypothetical protein
MAGVAEISVEAGSARERMTVHRRFHKKGDLLSLSFRLAVATMQLKGAGSYSPSENRGQPRQTFCAWRYLARAVKPDIFMGRD